LRGATTLDADTVEQMRARVPALLRELLDRNDVDHEDIISILFTATEDITAMFPATAARGAGLEDVPLLGAQELPIEGATPLCVRVLVHFTTERPRSELEHVYLEGARTVRDDVPR
jgi:chorismate mutase